MSERENGQQPLPKRAVRSRIYGVGVDSTRKRRLARLFRRASREAFHEFVKQVFSIGTTPGFCRTAEIKRGEVIAKGEVDSGGSYEVRLISSSTENEQRFGQDETRYDQRTFVRVETKSGATPALCQLAELFQSGQSENRQSDCGTKPATCQSRTQFRRHGLLASGTHLLVV
jgi:hypothetical protein